MAMSRYLCITLSHLLCTRKGRVWHCADEKYSIQEEAMQIGLGVRYGYSMWRIGV